MFNYKNSAILASMTLDELREELQLAYSNRMHYEATDSKQNWDSEEDARHKARHYTSQIYLILQTKITLEPRIKNLDNQLRKVLNHG